MHHPWKIYPVSSFDLNLNAKAIYGNDAIPFFSIPYSVFYMDGSLTKITKPAAIDINDNKNTLYL